MKLFALALLSLALFGLANAITCNNCKGKDCATGSCEGDYCVDKFTSNEDLGTVSYQRGCYTPVAGQASKPTFTTNGNVSCAASKLNQLTESMCVCSTEKCNTGSFHIGTTTTGPVECALGTASSITGTCKGDYCRYGEGILGVGCEYLDGFDDQDVFSPPQDIVGCYEKSMADGTTTSEQCSCGTANCNAEALKLPYKRPDMECEETVAFSNQVKKCMGSACYISGVFVQALNGFERGCIKVSGADPLVPFCKNSVIGGQSDSVQTCFCTESHCNKDIDTAKASMAPTTTPEPTTTTPTTTKMPSTTHKHKGAAGLQVSILAMVAGVFLRFF